MKHYKLLMMTPDGEDYQVEGEDLTLDEAKDLSANMGSRWIFYPLHFIIKDSSMRPSVEPNQRIIEAGELLDWAVNKSVNSVRKALAAEPILLY